MNWLLKHPRLSESLLKHDLLIRCRIIVVVVGMRWSSRSIVLLLVLGSQLNCILGRHPKAELMETTESQR